MLYYMERKRNTLAHKILSSVIAFSFITSMITPPPFVSAQVMPTTILNLPIPGAMIPASQGYLPAMMVGLTVHPENPLQFDFIVHTGDTGIEGDALKSESKKLIKYFLASLTVPEDQLWVNLSPYEKDRIVPEEFGITEMGRDMLAQDYILKQLTASMMYPEDNLGREFWDRVYTKAQALYGTTDIPMNTFNKIWIVPEKAVVYEHAEGAFVVNSRLKVMLEEDFVALQNNLGQEKFGTDIVAVDEAKVISGVTSEIVKEVLIPEIEREVNEGKNFAQVRQIYNALILATWYKQNLKDSLLGQVYVDKNKVKGVDVQDKQIKDKIYDQYIQAFKKGVYDYIKEEYDPSTQMVIPRKYFSGGFGLTNIGKKLEKETDPAELDSGDQVRLDRILRDPLPIFAVNGLLLEDTSEERVAQAVTPATTSTDAAMAEVEQKLLADFPGLFVVKDINGRQLDPLEVIAAMSEIGKDDIPRELNARRLLLESKKPARKKYAFPKWEDTFTDGQGNVMTFRQIVQGMMDNFLGIDSPLSWRMNDEVPIPDDINPLNRPGLQVTGPSEPINMAINQLNALLSARMPDLEDASAAWYIPAGAPKEQTVGAFAGIQNEAELLSGQWEGGRKFKKGKKKYELTQKKEDRPVTIQRVPSIHLMDKHITINGKAVPAIDVAYALHALNTYGALEQNGSGNYYYQPKIQTPKEALIVEKKLMKLEELMGLPLGTIKLEMLFEEGNAGRWLPAIMWVWRHRLIGSNVGRWDYIGSLIEIQKDEGVFPDPQSINMNTPNLMAYQRYNVLLNVMAGIKGGKQTNAAAIGGMAAVMLYPKSDRYGRFKNNPKAIRGMKMDKLRERLIGLIFVPDEDLKEGGQPTLEDILSGKVKGRLYDGYRQSWVATVDKDYVEAGNEPLRTDVEDLQVMLDLSEEWETLDGKRVAPKVSSGLIKEERDLFISLDLLNKEGKIAPWVIEKSKFNKPEDLFNEQLWNDLYSIPKGEITIENIQHAFYMSAQYGFQILNGNYAAAIDDYVLGLRFMNDLATYRIFVGSLQTAFQHQAKITKDGWIKDPELVADKGVVPNKNTIELKAGTQLTPEVFEQVWNAHNKWTKAFFAEQDRLGASSAFDRKWADVIMEVLKRQLLSQRYLQHSPRILFIIAEATPELRTQILDAIFDLTREEVESEVRLGSLDQQVLDARDYVFDHYEDSAATDAAMADGAQKIISALTPNQRQFVSKEMTPQTDRNIVDQIRSGGITSEKAQAWIANHAVARGFKDGKIVIVTPDNKERLLEEARQEEILISVGNGTDVAYSHPDDVQRVPKRTMTVTSDPKDAGLHNNWHPASELSNMLSFYEGVMDGGEDEVLYVVPYFMEPDGGNPHLGGQYFSAPSIHITTDLYVATGVELMTKVTGKRAIERINEEDDFFMAITNPGDLDKVKREGDILIVGSDTDSFEKIRREGEYAVVSDQGETLLLSVFEAKGGKAVRQLFTDRNKIDEALERRRNGFDSRIEHINLSEDQSVHIVTAEEDERFIIAVPELNLGASNGSAFGGNAFINKKVETLKIGNYRTVKALNDGVYQMVLHVGVVEYTNPDTGKTSVIAYEGPSNSGKTATATLASKYVRTLSDDLGIVMLDTETGDAYIAQPEGAIFAVMRNTSEKTNPRVLEMVGPGSGTIFTNMAFNPNVSDSNERVWWEGKTTDYPSDVQGWLDYRNILITDRVVTQAHVDVHEKYQGRDLDSLTEEELLEIKVTMLPWDHPNGRGTSLIDNLPGVSANINKWVKLDAIVFGGRQETIGKVPLLTHYPDLAQATHQRMFNEQVQATAAEQGAVVGAPKIESRAFNPFFGTRLTTDTNQQLAFWAMQRELKAAKGETPVEFFQSNWIHPKLFGLEGFQMPEQVFKAITDRLEGADNFEETPAGLIVKQDAIDLSGFKTITPEVLDLVRVPNLDEARNNLLLAWEKAMKEPGADKELNPVFLRAHNALRAKLGMEPVPMGADAAMADEAVSLVATEKLFADPTVKLSEKEEAEAVELQAEWDASGIYRPYSARAAIAKRPGMDIREVRQRANRQAEMFREAMADSDVVNAGLGAISARQAVMQALAGAPVIYVSGWQIAGKLLLPDISSHPQSEVINHVKWILDGLERASVYYRSQGVNFKTPPLVVDIDAGFGSPAAIFNLVRELIKLGVGIIHIEDQDPCEKACGHLGGKLKHPSNLYRNSVAAARMAFDVEGVDGVVIGRTDSEAATIVRGEGDFNDTDKNFIVGRVLTGETSSGKSMTLKEAEAAELIISWTIDETEKETLVRENSADKVWFGKELTRAEAREQGFKMVWNADQDEQQEMIEDLGETKVWIAQRSTPEGYYRVKKEGQKANIEYAIASAASYGDLADVVWMETKTPSLSEALHFRDAMNKIFPGKPLAYNLSPSFKWLKHFESAHGKADFIAGIKKLDLKGTKYADYDKDKFDWDEGYDATLAMRLFVPIIDMMGYKFQFITLAGFHSESYAQFDLADKFYGGDWMVAYSVLQEAEAAALSRGLRSERHQAEVGTFDFQLLDEHIKGGETTRKTMTDSTEAAQFTGNIYEETNKKIAKVKNILNHTSSVEGLRGLIVEIHIELNNVRTRISEVTADGDKLNKLNQQKDRLGDLARAAVRKLMPLKGSDQVTFSLTALGLKRIESRFNDPEGRYSKPQEGIQEDLFVLQAGQRQVENVINEVNDDEKTTLEMKELKIRSIITKGNNVLKRLESSDSAAIDSVQNTIVIRPDATGGIDLNPALLNLQIKRDANFVPLPLVQQPIHSMNIEGFIPVIINITPITNLPLLLGLADREESPIGVGYEDTDNVPFEARRRFINDRNDKLAWLN